MRTKKLTPFEAVNQELQRSRRELRLHRALRWPEQEPTPIDMDAALAGAENGRVVAWTYLAGYTRQDVLQGCFSSNFHSIGHTSRTNSQGRGGPWYATKLEALQALRAQVTRDVAATLLSIDEEILDEAVS